MKYIILVITLLWTTISFSQTGPGGVGNSSNNGLWLKANDIIVGSGSPISTWRDASGNANDANQIVAPTANPTFQLSSGLNNMPVVRFDGVDDEMAVADADILDNSTGITYYVVLRPNNLNGDPRGILGKRVTFTVLSDYSYTYFFHGGNRLNLDVETQNNRFDAGGTTFSNATNYIVGWDFDGTKPTTSRSRIRNGSEVIGTSSESSAAIQNSNQPLAIGALNVGYNTYLGADYAEVIQYNYYHNEIENILVNNYLSAKYNIPLVSNDVYDEDDAINGNYDFEVAGIGQTLGGINHTEAQGSGIVSVLNPSNLDNDEFFIWGHDNGIQQAVNTTDIPSSIQARLDRVWRVSEVNSSNTSVDVGTIDIRFDLTGLGGVASSDLVLLVDENNDGVFVNETPIAGATFVGGNTYQFTSVAAITNNLRFTLGTINNTRTVLPIELLNFTASPVENTHVELNWQTASEVDNDFFSVERSMDGSNWEKVVDVIGKGNTQKLESYSVKDDSPLTGLSYYRLKQTDLDQQFSYSKVVAVEIQRQELVRVYPNPTSDELIISGNKYALNEITIFNNLGQNVTQQTKIKRKGEERVIVDMSMLSKGIYIVKTATAVRKVSKQ